MTAIRPWLVFSWLLLPGTVLAAERNRLPAQARAILDKAAWIHVYSLDPRSVDARAKTFRTWRLLGKTTVKDAKVRDKLLDALYRGIRAKAKTTTGFQPRYALRASHAGRTVDLLVCFECGWVFVYYDGRKTESAIVRIAPSPDAVFAKILQDARVPLAKPR
jgi:hypothetical protein